MPIIIKNGTIVNADNTFNSDIIIENGKIIKITNNIQAGAKDKLIDAKNKIIFPGAIDPHVHMHLPVFSGYSADDFYTGSIAALYGGTTTIIDFVTPQKGERLSTALKKRKKEAEKSLVNYSFHVSPVEWRDTLPQEIVEIIKQGCTSFKVYMAYKQSIGLDDDDLYKVMQTVAKTGALLTVHAELGDEIENLRNNFSKTGKTTAKYHPLSRPDYTEALAVKKVLQFAEETGCPLYIVHVSAKKSLKYIREAQKKGQKVFAETCPHYLLLDDSRYTTGFDHAAPFVLSPPLRKKEDNDALWEAIADETILTMGTDHCPFSVEMKRKGINDFRYIPNGAGGIEHRLELLYTYGVLQNKISINKFVDIITTQPAKIFGLYPQKGIIKEGADADIVLWNTEKEKTISVKNHHQNCDNNIYEGIYTKGAPEQVIINGKLILNKGEINTRFLGKFVKRYLK
ncbi:MAG: dihydropyrimidinase [Bacteroidales bacterium]|nr:dihydropyrimidinase [Bacteroidales bacterium]